MGLRADGSIATWGLCDVGQCGVPLPNSGYTAISAGDSHSLALRPGGAIVAWGSNENGELQLPSPNTGFVAIAAGLLHNLALKPDGSIVGWGSNIGGESIPPQPNTDWVAIAAGGYFSIGLKSDGSIRRWGCNGLCPVPSPNTGFVAVSTHFYHSLALRADGSIVAWGTNDYGQLDVPEPNTGFVAIAAGDHFSLGLKADGSIVSWGEYNQSSVPQPNTGYTQVTANRGFAHALRSEVTFTERVVSTNAPLSTSVVAADVDGDGDTDAVTAEYQINTVAWYENNGATPPGWTKHFVDNGTALGATTVAAGDVDGDGDADVFSANLNDEGIAFYENRGTSWVKQVLTGYWVGAWVVHVADVDGDGDLDGISGLGQSNCGPPLSCPGVEWYDNNGTTPPTFTARAVSPDQSGSGAVHAADLDGDGDVDIPSVDTSPNQVLWFENSGAHPLTWTKRIIGTVNEPWSVFSADVDGDGDVDVLTASSGNSLIAWHENNGASPPGWTTRTVSASCQGATAVRAADIDADGDIDVVGGCSGGSPSGRWYENNGGSPPIFTEHPVGMCGSAMGIFAAAVDADTDIDVLCSTNGIPGKVLFFENNGTGGSGCSGDNDCVDGLFCNGAEDCAGGQCQTGASPCAPPLLCRESDDQCVQCLTSANCTDGLFCNGAETCGPAGTCQAGSNPCTSPLFCRESDDQCVQCLNSSTCDDGLFCNGAESCNAAGNCQAGGNPCPGQGCDETNNACVVGQQVWLSFIDSASMPGVGTVQNEDIVARNVSGGAWSMIFDGSDVGLSGLTIDGMARVANGNILLSFTESGSVAGMTGGPSGTTLDDSDIVRFIPTSLGSTTAGSFVFYFDGSDVGLTTDNEDIDAIALTSGGQLVISTVGAVSATGASGADTDLLLFNATSLGSVTSGSFSIHFDGSDVSLSDNGNEDVDAAAIRPTGAILLSTIGNFAVPGVSGANEDVLQFTPTTLGSSTSGTYSMHLDLSALGIATSEDVGAVEFKD